MINKCKALYARKVPSATILAEDKGMRQKLKTKEPNVKIRKIKTLYLRICNKGEY